MGQCGRPAGSVGMAMVITASLGIAAWHAAGPASAQPMMSAPSEIASCLCLERDIGTRQAEMTVRRNAYEGLGRDIQEAEATLDRERGRIDVNDQAAIDGFRQRLDALDGMKVRHQQVALPDYQAAVQGYNDRVAQYTQRCSGRTLDPNVTERVRPNLVCRMDQ